MSKDAQPAGGLHEDLLADALAALEDPDAGGYNRTKVAEAIRARLDEDQAVDERPVERAERPFWQTEPCPPWCNRRIDGTAHQDSDGFPDRTHFSDWQGKIVLTLVEEPYDEWYQHRTRDWTEPEFANVYLQQHYREVEPRVWLGRSDTSHGWDLTPGEARALADELVKGADLAEGLWGAE